MADLEGKLTSLGDDISAMFGFDCRTDELKKEFTDSLEEWVKMWEKRFEDECLLEEEMDAG